MITRMWQGAHALPISYNNENKREGLRRPPAGLQLFFKCWHTEGIIYYFTLLWRQLQVRPELTNSVRSYQRHPDFLMS
jgi:hypothetical protein